MIVMISCGGRLGLGYLFMGLVYIIYFSLDRSSVGERSVPGFFLLFTVTCEGDSM